MQINPFINLRNHFSRGFAIYHTIKHTNAALIVTIREMNVRRIVITPIQADNNSKKAANLWHSIYCFNYYSAKIEKKNYFLNKKRVFYHN